MLTILRSSRKWIWLLVILSLAACSTTNRKGKYNTGAVDTSLDVPPGLSKPKQTESMAVPSIASDRTSYSKYQQQDSGDSANRDLLPPIKNAKLVRDGDLRWLEIELPPQQVWDDMIRFLRSEGFKIKYQNPATGVIQTDWQENQEYLPTNWFARTMNKLSSTGLMDRYRVRLERTDDPNRTVIYLSHAGMEEIAYNEAVNTDVVDTLWQPRSSDPELEAEMLLRFLVFQGMAEPEAEKIVAPEEKEDVIRAEFANVDGAKVINVKENFPRTWRRVGLAIDRLGLTLDDKVRSDGIYLISLNEDFLKTHQEEEGLVGKLFGGGGKQQTEFAINIVDQGETSVVSVKDRDGKYSDAPNAALVTELLYAQLR
jgi:outer membrane protein assembly factor BamC